jgi:hypothetical protein
MATKSKKQATKKATTKGGKDKFGFRLGTAAAKAATMYAAKGGATQGEIKEVCGSPMRNMLTAAELRGFKVTTTKRKCKITGNETMAFHLA